MRAVILTKSYKRDKNNISGWCVVAFDLDKGKLVRFVDHDGAAIPEKALDGKGIGMMDIVSVTVIKELPQGPQSENLLVNPSSFQKLGYYTPGIGKIMSMLGELPKDEPRFMADCEYRYWDVSRFHHSIEILGIRNVKSCTHKYSDGMIKRYCQFDTDAGHNKDVRITAQNFYNLEYDWETGDVIAVVTIPAEPWFVGGKNTGCCKFVAALYVMPPNEKA